MPKIKCKIRQIEVVLTPEEKVRQKLIHWLLSQGVPENMCLVEQSLSLWDHSTQNRADLLIRHPKLKIDEGQFWMLLECKRPGEDLDAALDQCRRYQQHIDFNYACVTDGQVIRLYQSGSWNELDKLPNWVDYL